jgi:hypothetical protein
MSIRDDVPIVICPLPGAFAGGAWMPDGRILFNIVRGPLMSVAASGGDPVEVLATSENQIDFHRPDMMPDGKTALSSVHRQEGVDTIAASDDGLFAYTIDSDLRPKTAGRGGPHRRGCPEDRRASRRTLPARGVS